VVAHCSQPTYEELKRRSETERDPYPVCSQPTYEELKPTWRPSEELARGGSQPTYEELKQQGLLLLVQRC